MMLDLERIRAARLGPILDGNSGIYQIQGTKDGRDGHPSDRLTVADTLVAQAADALGGYRSDLATNRITLEGQLAIAEKNQQNALNTLAQLRGAKSQALNELNQEHQNRTGGLKKRHAEAEQRYQLVVAQVQGRPLRAGNPYIYLALMGLIAFVEWPINRFAFEAYFQEAPAIASVIALAVGTMMAAVAHFVGTISRRMEYGTASREKRIRYLVPLVGLLCFTFFVIYVIALARHEFVKLLTAQDVSAKSLFEGKLATAVTEGFFSPSFGPQDWGLLVINLLVFLVAIGISYASHDPHPDYARAHRERNRLMHQEERSEAKFARKFRENHSSRNDLATPPEVFERRRFSDHSTKSRRR